MVVFPGTTVSTPSVFVMVRFATWLIVSVSVSSSVPRSSVTLAVLMMVPVAFALTSATTVYVIIELAGRSATSLIPASVVPFVVTVAPLASTALTDVTVIFAGKVSVMLAAVTSDGPSFVTLIV